MFFFNMTSISIPSLKRPEYMNVQSHRAVEQLDTRCLLLSSMFLQVSTQWSANITAGKRRKAHFWLEGDWVLSMGIKNCSCIFPFLYRNPWCVMISLKVMVLLFNLQPSKTPSYWHIWFFSSVFWCFQPWEPLCALLLSCEWPDKRRVVKFVAVELFLFLLIKDFMYITALRKSVSESILWLFSITP